jgi:hypothetical protein
MTADVKNWLIFLGALFGFLSIGVVVVIYGSIVRNRWGANTGDVFCPHCKAPLPRFRVPRSLRQELWGGWMCPTCGAEVDKWGRELSTGPGWPPGEDNPYLIKGYRSGALVVLILALLLIGVFDYYDPPAIKFDPFVAAYFVWRLSAGRHRQSFLR